MYYRPNTAPGFAHRAGPGAFVIAFALVAGTACETPPQLRPPAEVELENRTVLLEHGAEVWEVLLQGVGTNHQLSPDSVEARPGDVVRFVAADAMVHAAGFDADALGPEQRAFLERTGQLSSPPLLSTGAAWVVSLEDAPPGIYPFRCLTHGGEGTLYIPAPE